MREKNHLVGQDKAEEGCLGNISGDSQKQFSTSTGPIFPGCCSFSEPFPFHIVDAGSNHEGTSEGEWAW